MNDCYFNKQLQIFNNAKQSCTSKLKILTKNTSFELNTIESITAITLQV